jgi:hypothetical protein
MADARQALRMTHEQIAAWDELSGQPGDELFLRGAIKINHHVPAKNELKWLGKTERPVN